MNKIIHNILLVLCSFLILCTAACSDKHKVTGPNIVSFTHPALYPEGVDYDVKGKRFLVTSMREGTVGTVSDDGKYSVLINDPQLVSAVGIRIDQARDRILVCNSDPGASIRTKKENQAKLSGLGIYSLSTGQRQAYIDLGAMAQGGHFCNDIALDKAGNAYISDSFSPIIYKIDTNNRASILLMHKRFTGKGFNLNGLVVKDDYLIVAKYNEGTLFKIPLNSPGKFSQIKIDQTMPGADGLLWAADGSLIVIANKTTNKLFKLSSTDNWDSAKVIKTSDAGKVFPTTGVLRNGEVYVLNAMLHVLFNPNTTAHTETFQIQKHKM